MKGIWRKCLGRSAGFVLGSLQAAEPPIIAWSGPTPPPPRTAETVPPAVCLGRPRAVATSPAGVRQASFREENPAATIAIARSATIAPQPMPAGPDTAANSPIVTLPPPTPLPSPPPTAPGGAVVVMPPGVSPEFAASWSGYGA